MFRKDSQLKLSLRNVKRNSKHSTGNKKKLDNLSNRCKKINEYLCVNNDGGKFTANDHDDDDDDDSSKPEEDNSEKDDSGFLETFKCYKNGNKTLSSWSSSSSSSSRSLSHSSRISEKNARDKYVSKTVLSSSARNIKPTISSAEGNSMSTTNIAESCEKMVDKLNHRESPRVSDDEIDIFEDFNKTGKEIDDRLASIELSLFQSFDPVADLKNFQANDTNCPLCLKKFAVENTKTFIAHLKNCSSKYNVSVEKLLVAFELQKKQSVERTTLGLPSISEVKSTLKKNGTKKSTTVDSNLELALALSVSLEQAERERIIKEAECLIEAGLEDEALERSEQVKDNSDASGNINFLVPQKFGKTKNKWYRNTLLYTRSEAERERIITEKVATILIDNSNGDDCNYFNDVSRIVSCTIRSSLLKRIIDETTTWWTRSCQFQENQNVYYVPCLNDFVYMLENNADLIRRKQEKSTPYDDQIPAEFLLSNSELEKRIFPSHYEKKSAAIRHQQSSTNNALSVVQLANLRRTDEGGDGSSISLSIDWKRLVGNSAMSDITIYAKDEKCIAAHKLVFLARCEAILRDCITEEDTNAGKSKDIIVWMEYSYEAVRAFLETVYTAQMTDFADLSSSEKDEFIQLCERYNFSIYREGTIATANDCTVVTNDCSGNSDDTVASGINGDETSIVTRPANKEYEEEEYEALQNLQILEMALKTQKQVETGRSVYSLDGLKSIHECSEPIHECSEPIHECSDPINECSEPIHECSEPINDESVCSKTIHNESVCSEPTIRRDRNHCSGDKNSIERNNNGESYFSLQSRGDSEGFRKAVVDASQNYHDSGSYSIVEEPNSVSSEVHNNGVASARITTKVNHDDRFDDHHDQVRRSFNKQIDDSKCESYHVSNRSPINDRLSDNDDDDDEYESLIFSDSDDNSANVDDLIITSPSCYSMSKRKISHSNENNDNGLKKKRLKLNDGSNDSNSTNYLKVTSNNQSPRSCRSSDVRSAQFSDGDDQQFYVENEQPRNKNDIAAISNTRELKFNRYVQPITTSPLFASLGGDEKIESSQMQSSLDVVKPSFEEASLPVSPVKTSSNAATVQQRDTDDDDDVLRCDVETKDAAENVSLRPNNKWSSIDSFDANTEYDDYPYFHGDDYDGNYVTEEDMPPIITARPSSKLLFVNSETNPTKLLSSDEETSSPIRCCNDSELDNHVCCEMMKNDSNEENVERFNQDESAAAAVSITKLTSSNCFDELSPPTVNASSANNKGSDCEWDDYNFDYYDDNYFDLPTTDYVPEKNSDVVAKAATTSANINGAPAANFTSPPIELTVKNLAEKNHDRPLNRCCDVSGNNGAANSSKWKTRESKSSLENSFSFSCSFLDDLDLGNDDNSCKVAENQLVTPSRSSVAGKSLIRSKSESFITDDTTPLSNKVTTPLPNYSIMKTVELKKELDKYGLKPNLGKKKSKLLLRYIYNQLHPLISEDEISDIEDNNVKNVSSKKKCLMAEFDKSTTLTMTATTTSKKFVDDISSSDAESTDSKFSGHSLCLNSGTEEEDHFADDLDICTQPAKTQTQIISIKSGMLKLIALDPALHKKILLYEPISVENLKASLKEIGVKCNMNNLIDYLDEKCITYRYNNRSFGRRRKKRSKNKRSRSTARSQKTKEES